MNRFYFHRSYSHDFAHCGHVKLHKKEAKLGLRNMDDEVLTAVSEMLAKHCPTTLANQFLQLLTGGRPTTGSINSPRNCVLVRKYGSNPDETTAETLKHILKSSDDVEHVSHAASCKSSQVAQEFQERDNAVSILNSIDDHVAFVLPIPDVNITSSSIRNNDNGITLSELLEIKEDTKIRNNDNQYDNAIIIFTSGTTSDINKGVRASSRSLKT